MTLAHMACVQSLSWRAPSGRAGLRVLDYTLHHGVACVDDDGGATRWLPNLPLGARSTMALRFSVGPRMSTVTCGAKGCRYPIHTQS